jgi:hypothetical protein
VQEPVGRKLSTTTSSHHAQGEFCKVVVHSAYRTSQINHINHVGISTPGVWLSVLTASLHLQDVAFKRLPGLKLSPLVALPLPHLMLKALQ